MALLQKIRNHSALIVISVGLALAAFVLGDLFKSGSMLHSKSKDKAFVVGGETIPTKEYFNRVSQWENLQKMIKGQNSIDDQTSNQIKEFVYTQMVKERLIKKQAEKLGLSVSKKELNNIAEGKSESVVLTQLPLFTDSKTGKYSPQELKNFLEVINKNSSDPNERQMIENYRYIWLSIENLIKSQRLEEKYTNLISNSISVTDVEAKQIFDLDKYNSDLIYTSKKYNSIPDSTVNVSDKEIEDFYNKQKDNFKVNVPFGKVSFLLKKVSPSKEDFDEVFKNAQKAYSAISTTNNVSSIVSSYSDAPFHDLFLSKSDLTPDEVSFIQSASVGDAKGPIKLDDSYRIYKFVDKINAPDSVNLQMIYLPSDVSRDSTMNIVVDSLYNEISKGKSFDQVANSINPNSNGGNIGWVKELDIASFGLGNDFAKTVFNAPLNKIQKINNSNYKLLFVLKGKTSNITKYKLAYINMPVVPSEKTSNSVDYDLNMLVSNDSLKNKFIEMSSKKGYEVNPLVSVTANDLSISNIPNSRQVIKWVFNEGKPGDVKKFDLNNVRIIAQIDQINPPGFVPLTEISSNIRAKLSNDKKAEKIISELESKKLTTLDEYSNYFSSKVDTLKSVSFTLSNIPNLGYEPVINAVASSLPLNSLSSPMQGNNGVYVSKVINKSEKSDGGFNQQTEKNYIKSSNVYRVNIGLINELKDKIGVEDNRYRFY